MHRPLIINNPQHLLLQAVDPGDYGVLVVGSSATYSHHNLGHEMVINLGNQPSQSQSEIVAHWLQRLQFASPAAAGSKKFKVTYLLAMFVITITMYSYTSLSSLSLPLYIHV